MIVSYVYKITNKITNQFYIGSRYKNINENRSPVTDLWVYYFTSSKDVADLINLHGKESFNLEFIFYGNNDINDDITYWVEQELIKENINDALCMNKQYQDRELGQQKFLLAGTESHWKGKKKGVSPKKGKIFGEQKNSYTVKGKDNPYKGKERPNQQGKERKKNTKIICPHCNKQGGSAGMKHYHFDKCDMNSDNIQYSRKLGKQTEIACPYCNKSGGISNMKRYHFEKCKYNIIKKEI